jgi:hypothetical protein
MILSNYFSIYRIIDGINNLLFSNCSGVTSFLKTPLISLLLHTLDSTISIENTSSDEDIGEIQKLFKKEKNKFKNYFDENNRLNGLLDLFRYLISHTLSPIQKEIINSIAIYQLLKIERLPFFYGCVLEYVNKLKLSPSPTSGFDFPSDAKKTWNEVLNFDECLWDCYQFKEIIVSENFEVKNGISRLHH